MKGTLKFVDRFLEIKLDNIEMLEEDRYIRSL